VVQVAVAVDHQVHLLVLPVQAHQVKDLQAGQVIQAHQAVAVVVLLQREITQRVAQRVQVVLQHLLIHHGLQQQALEYRASMRVVVVVILTVALTALAVAVVLLVVMQLQMLPLIQDQVLVEDLAALQAMVVQEL
jgi:hypothetical protein